MKGVLKYFRGNHRTRFTLKTLKQRIKDLPATEEGSSVVAPERQVYELYDGYSSPDKNGTSFKYTRFQAQGATNDIRPYMYVCIGIANVYDTNVDLAA